MNLKIFIRIRIRTLNGSEKQSNKEFSKFNPLRMEHLDMINKYIETANHILMKRFGKQLPLKYYEFIRNERIFVRGNSYPLIVF